MSRLLVHAGLHKTGTSAIQRFLADNRDWLMRNRYYYPNSFSFDAHHNLADRLKFCKNIDEAHGYLCKTLRHYKDCAGNNDVIVSSEMFSESLDPRKLAVMPDVFENVTFIFYVRLQDDLTESAYNQQVRQNGETRKIHEFNPYLTNIYKHLDWFKRSVPTASVVAYEYNKNCFLGGDLIIDFVRRVLNIEELGGARFTQLAINESISPVACELLRRVNSLRYSAELREPIINILIKAFPISAYGTFTLLSPDYRRSIVGECEISNRMLRQRFLKSGDMVFRRTYQLDFLEESVIEDLVANSNLRSLISSTSNVAEDQLIQTLMPNRH